MGQARFGSPFVEVGVLKSCRVFLVYPVEVIVVHYLIHEPQQYTVYPTKGLSINRTHLDLDSLNLIFQF
jgi:hypothetical protein